ncbi:hypothetical protein [Psychrilyobacter sp.]|uniref:hypothetical protein n=1 Tax=Psychrilyobacter sp. TaxID=2586924 RepID=UPI003016FCC8
MKLIKLINLVLKKMKKIMFMDYKIIVTYDGMEYSECNHTGTRRIRFFLNRINQYGNLVKIYAKNDRRNYLIDYEYLKGENNYPRSPKEILGSKPIPKR